MSAIELRPYQMEAVESLLNSEHRQSLCAAATGSGKTEIFFEILKQTPKLQSLIILNKLELLDQTIRRLSRVFPHEKFRIYCGSRKKEYHNARITIALIQSIAKTKAAFHFDQIFLDEVHALDFEKTDSRYMKLCLKYPHAKIFGFTATPYRTNSGYVYGENKFFPELTYQIKMDLLIKEGFLVPPTLKGSKYAFDVSGLKLRAGDYREEDLSRLVSNEELVTAQVKDALSRLEGRNKIVWCCCNIKHAELVQRKIGDAAILHSKLKKDDRFFQKNKFERTDCRHLVFITIVSEGWDFPPTDAVVLMRPTRSAVLYVQTVGRALRPAGDKKDALILDYGRVVEFLGPVNNPKIREPQKERKSKGLEVASEKMCPNCLSFVAVSTQVCPDCGFIFAVPNLTHKAEAKFNILETTKPEQIYEMEVKRIKVSEHVSKAGNKCYRFEYGSILTKIDFMVDQSWNHKNIAQRFKDLGLPCAYGVWNVDLTIRYKKTDYGIKVVGIERGRDRATNIEMAQQTTGVFRLQN